MKAAGPPLGLSPCNETKELEFQFPSVTVTGIGEKFFGSKRTQS